MVCPEMLPLRYLIGPTYMFSRKGQYYAFVVDSQLNSHRKLIIEMTDSVSISASLSLPRSTDRLLSTSFDSWQQLWLQREPPVVHSC